MWVKLALVTDKEPYQILRTNTQSIFVDNIDERDETRLGKQTVNLCKNFSEDEKKAEKTKADKEKRYGTELLEA